MSRVSLVSIVLLMLGVPVGAADSLPETIICALPVIERSGLRDIQESLLNGPEGYAFFAEADAPKTGNLPRSVGSNPTLTVDTHVYASNFQGPILVSHEGLRPQWEWTADGELQISERRYPVPLAHRCAPAEQLPTVMLHVLEHDEWPWRNDKIGAIAFDLSHCNKAISGGTSEAWTSKQRSEGAPYGIDGPAEIAFIEYRLWCSIDS